MANFQTTLAAAQDNYSKLRNGRPSLRDVQQDVKVAEFTYTADGTEVTTDTIELGSLDVDAAVLIPGASTVRLSAGTMTNTLGVGLTSAAITAATTAVAATAIGAAFAGVAAPPAIARASKLFLTTSSTLTLAAGAVVTVRIAYSSPQL